MQSEISAVNSLIKSNYMKSSVFRELERRKQQSLCNKLNSIRPNSMVLEKVTSSDDDRQNSSVIVSEYSEFDETSDYDGHKRLNSMSKENVRNIAVMDDDDSTCCADDFTWVRSESSTENQLLQSDSLPPSKPRKNRRSLDRKRNIHANRKERDYKSKSVHSLREECLRNEFSKNVQNDNGCRIQSCSDQHCRSSPSCWDIRQAPLNSCRHGGCDRRPLYECYSSKEDIRNCGHHHNNHDLFYHTINGALSMGSQEFLNNMSHFNRCMPPLCPYDYRSMWHLFQRQDVDERVRRLQAEKESLTLQIQMLTEQVSSQNDKIVELERSLTEKTQLLNNTEDMLQRELLSRSSLETQKLELMSAMSELKLQQAALERENMELRATHTNNNSITRRSQGSTGNFQSSKGTNSATPKTPPASFRHQINPHFNSLPRAAFTTSPNGISSADNNANPRQRNVAFAEDEQISQNSPELLRSFTSHSTTSPPLGQKSRGLRSIFGKIRRSNSGNLEDLTGEGEFKRGGIRATAGARLGWSQSAKPTKPFNEWNVDDLCAWFDDMGLICYEEDLRRWLKSGSEDIIKASPVDIEKELNLKSPLHRKKIVLALDELSGKEIDEMTINAGKLDTSWIMRWLDDIGLPQHKDAFLSARVDGRMLHKLTLEDLAHLHVTSCLHVASLKRGIQVMRENNWNSDCLIRRSNNDGEKVEPVCLWTAHRVMEWLRVVDLAEYAPNLRGAGVHGALMTYEPKFTAELLADLLSIPPSKTLLRRHLATHFKELLGRDVIQKKRNIENTLGYQPLTITAKIKTPKKSQFSLKRKKSLKGIDEWSDYVCPMGPSGDHLLSSNCSNQNTATGLSTMNSTTQDNVEEVEAVSSQANTGSPTSTKSSNSTS